MVPYSKSSTFSFEARNPNGEMKLEGQGKYIYLKRYLFEFKKNK